MRPAIFFENTPVVATLRLFSRGRVCPHPRRVSHGNPPLAGPSPPDGGRDASERAEDSDRPLAQGQKERDDTDTSREGKKEEFLVTWDGDEDPMNPKNFSGRAKCFILVQVSDCSLSST
jgi:hypothetical protein